MLDYAINNEMMRGANLPPFLINNSIFRGDKAMTGNSISLSEQKSQLPKKCKCGCGGDIVWQYWYKYQGIPVFIKGHSSRMPGHFIPVHNVKHSEESKRKMSENHARLSGKNHPNYGKHLSIETRNKISIARIGKYCGKENPFYGRHHTDEMKATQSKMRSEQYSNGNNPFQGKTHKKETLSKIREKAIKRNADPEYRKMISECTKKAMTPEVRDLISQSWKSRSPEWKVKKSKMEKKRWREDKNFAERMRKSRNAKPNKSEIKLNDILDEMYPGEWKFTGDFSFIINGKNPDFVNCNGKKLIIELFGEYWHQGETQEDRAKCFSPFGYRTLVIWWKELQDKELTINKIRGFIENARV